MTEQPYYPTVWMKMPTTWNTNISPMDMIYLWQGKETTGIKVKNEYGENLTELCSTTNLQILNGRTLGDLYGEFTYCGIRLLSTVDYILSSGNVIKDNEIQYMRVQAITFLSLNPELSSLMFADDLVLVSTTNTGLHQYIENLSQYCKKWNLTINLKKTKIVTFSKTGKIENTNHNIDGTNLEKATGY